MAPNSFFFALLRSTNIPPPPPARFPMLCGLPWGTLSEPFFDGFLYMIPPSDWVFGLFSFFGCQCLEFPTDVFTFFSFSCQCIKSPPASLPLATFFSTRPPAHISLQFPFLCSMFNFFCHCKFLAQGLFLPLFFLSVHFKCSLETGSEARFNLPPFTWALAVIPFLSPVDCFFCVLMFPFLKNPPSLTKFFFTVLRFIAYPLLMTHSIFLLCFCEIVIPFLCTQV